MAETKYYLDEAGLRALWTKLSNRDQEIVTKILANTSAIDLLNSQADGDNPAPEGSVARTVADEIAKVVAGAPESFDTLKEIADWIAGNPDGAAGMNALIQANKADIAKIKALLETQEEDNALTSSRLDTIESNVKTNSDDIANLQAALGVEGTGENSISKRVESLENTINGYTTEEDGEVEGLVSKVESNTSAIADNTKDIETNTKDIETNANDISTLKETINGTEDDSASGLVSKVATLESSVSELQSVSIDGISEDTVNDICVFSATLE